MVKDRVLKVLLSGRQFTPAQLAGLTGTSEGSVRPRISELRSEGHAIYNGNVSDIKQYAEQTLNIEFPKFVNPSDFLIKLAVVPQIINPKLTLDEVKFKGDQAYKMMLIKEQKEISLSKIEDLKGITSVRGSSFI